MDSEDSEQVCDDDDASEQHVSPHVLPPPFTYPFLVDLSEEICFEVFELLVKDLMQFLERHILIFRVKGSVGVSCC